MKLELPDIPEIAEDATAEEILRYVAMLLVFKAGIDIEFQKYTKEVNDMIAARLFAMEQRIDNIHEAVTGSDGYFHA